MKELRSILARLRQPAAFPAALATLARVRGSSYRRPGARLLLTADGARTGAISGGCLEDDVLVRAAAVAAGGAAQAVTYDTTAENDLVWGVGLGCHGVVDVVVERLTTDNLGWATVVREAFDQQRDAALAIVFQADMRYLLGTHAALSGNGPLWTKEKATAYEPGLQQALKEKRSHCARLETLAGRPWVFFEYVSRPNILIIFGAGDDAQPLCRMAADLGFSVKVVDSRPMYATKKRFPDAEAVFVAKADELSRGIPDAERTACVVMTHHYVHDLPYLGWAFRQAKVPYIGLLGPRQRAEKILGDLAAGGLEITPAMRSRLRAPVGLDVGATTPESVALAVLAEIQAVLAGRDGRPLREREGAIHGE